MYTLDDASRPPGVDYVDELRLERGSTDEETVDILL